MINYRLEEISQMIKIITDTTSGLPLEISNRYQIPVIPQILNFGNQSFYEIVDIDNPTFMSKLRAAKELPTTAAPPPELFIKEFTKLASPGTTIFCIHPSAEISGTVRSALMAAKEFPNADIRVIDTRTIGSQLSTLVLLAAEWASQGEDAEVIEKKIKQMIPRGRIYFLVDTLEYLAKGGRIGGATALLGSVLKIKPILILSDGRVDQFEKERTQKHAMMRLIELVKSQASRNGNPYISIMHAAIPELAQEFADILCKEFNIKSIPILDVPPVIVVHGGPGILGAAFFIDEN